MILRKKLKSVLLFRAIGSDIEQNALLLKAGDILTPASLGILATVGVCDIPVVG